MKALLIADADATVGTVAKYLKPYGFDVIRYRSAVKAIDNIPEIAPDAVFISTADFPRHWKTIVQFIRSDTEKEKTVIVLLTNERFTAEDADKATHIGAQAIVGESLSEPEDERKLGEVFARYRHVGPQNEPVEIENPGNRVTFMFTNPRMTRSSRGPSIVFRDRTFGSGPTRPRQPRISGAGDELDQCPLRIDATTISPRCASGKTET
jgi:hypothetical protein